MKDAFTAVAVGSLFSLSNTAVIGTQNRMIVFMNPAAQRILGCDETGRSASRLFPPHILQSQASEFISSATIAGHHAIVAVTSLSSFRLYTLTFDQQEDAKTSPVFAPHLSTLANFRLVTEYFMHYTEQLNDPKFARYSAELMKCYYQIHRWSVNAATLSALMNKTLPFLPVAVNLKAFFEEMLDGVQFFSEIHGIEITFDAPDGNLIYMLDPELVERMVLNILSNSLMHCKRGDRVRITLSVGNDNILLSVHDTGSGIPADKMASIFCSYLPRDPALTKDDGSGFGLAVALGIAELHGGTILVESSAQNGTSIRVLLSAKLPVSGQFKAAPPAYGAQQSANLLSGLSDFLDVSDFQSKLLD